MPKKKKNVKKKKKKNNQRKNNVSVPYLGNNMKQSLVSVPRAIGGTLKSGRKPLRVDVEHTELFTQLSGSQDFSVFNMAINPGLNSSFPWLSSVANSWDIYEVLAITFTYLPACSSATSGFFMLAFDYDTLDTSPPDMNTMMQMADSCAGPVWNTCSLTLKPADLRARGKLFIRPGGISNSDLKTYDLGRVYWACQGNSTELPLLGQLTVSYVVRLSKPSPAVPIYSYYGDLAVTSGDATHPFGTVIVTPTSHATPININSATTGNIVALRPGTYMLVYSVGGTGISFNTSMFTVTYPASFPNDKVGAYSYSFTAVYGILYVPVRLSDNSALTFNLATAATVTSYSFQAYPVDAAILP